MPPPGAKKNPVGMTFFGSYPGQCWPGMMPTTGNYEDSWWHTLGQPALKMRNFLMFQRPLVEMWRIDQGFLSVFEAINQFRGFTFRFIQKMGQGPWLDFVRDRLPQCFGLMRVRCSTADSQEFPPLYSMRYIIQQESHSETVKVGHIQWWVLWLRNFVVRFVIDIDTYVYWPEQDLPYHTRNNSTTYG